jgi:hypothetical protein
MKKIDKSVKDQSYELTEKISRMEYLLESKVTVMSAQINVIEQEQKEMNMKINLN